VQSPTNGRAARDRPDRGRGGILRRRLVLQGGKRKENEARSSPPSRRSVSLVARRSFSFASAPTCPPPLPKESKPTNKNKQWSFHAGPAWELIQGHAQGQTHVDRPHDAGITSGFGGGGIGSAPPVVWSHPLDVHYALRGLSGWPRLQVQVWREDGRGRSEIC
jgi:hypothetical protein